MLLIISSLVKEYLRAMTPERKGNLFLNIIYHYSYFKINEYYRRKID